MSHPKVKNEKRHEQQEQEVIETTEVVRWSRRPRTNRRSLMRRQGSSSRVASTRKLDLPFDHSDSSLDARALLEQRKDQFNSPRKHGSIPALESSDTSLHSSGSSFDRKLMRSPNTPPKKTRNLVRRVSQSSKGSNSSSKKRMLHAENRKKDVNREVRRTASCGNAQDKQHNPAIVLNTPTRQPLRKSRNSSRVLSSAMKTDLMDLLRQHSSRSLGDASKFDTTRSLDAGTTASSKKKSRRSGMKRLLHNKRKIEKELNSNELFQFVLKRSSMDKFHQEQAQDKKNSNGNEDNQNNSSSSNNSNEKNGTKISLDKFMKMKETSEQLFSQSNHNPNNKNSNRNKNSATASMAAESDNGTWGLGSICFSQPDFGNDLQEEDEEDPTASAEDDDVYSVVSMDLKDAVGPTSPKSKPGSSTSLHEEMESQTLSLSIADVDYDDEEDDEDSSAVASETATKQVTGFAVADPVGRKGIYTGPVSRSSGMPHGTGRLEYPDQGEIFEGQFVHGYWTGYGTCFYTNTGEVYTGFFLNNIKHGHGVTKYQDGRVYDGTYSHGVKSEGKMTYQDGSTYLGQWSRGARNGRGTYTFPNGSVFFGEFVDDSMNGSGVLTWASGGRYVGSWKNGLRHGQGKDYRPDGSLRREGIWQSGKFYATLA